MLQGDAASPIRPPCSDSSRLTVETRGMRNHPDPVNGASGPAPSNAPQPSTAAASSCAATGARRLEALRAHEDTWRKRLPTVRAGVRRTSRATAGRAPERLIEEEPPDDDATARQQIPAESPAARLRRMVYEVYLRHGEVVLPRVVRDEIPGIAVDASDRSRPLERAIIAARNQWRAEGRPLPRSSYTTDDLPMRERLDRLERAMALLGEECPPQHDGRAVRSSALYDEWADLKARFAAIIEPETPFDSASPDDWERVSMRYQRS